MANMFFGTYYPDLNVVGQCEEQQQINKGTSEKILKGKQSIPVEELKNTPLFSAYKSDSNFNKLLGIVSDEKGYVDADGIEFLGIAADAAHYQICNMQTQPLDFPDLKGFYLDGIAEKVGFTHFEDFTEKDFQAYKKSKAEAHAKQVQDVSDLKKQSADYQAKQK